MCSYHHLTTAERGALFILYSLHYSIRQIAKILGYSPSTISRELRRNARNGSYSPDKAQEKYHYRKTHLCGRKCILADPAAQAIVIAHLEESWSPEQISHRLVLEHCQLSISYNSIYRGIRKGLLRQGFSSKAQSIRYYTSKLRHHGKPYHRKNKEDRRGSYSIKYTIHDLPKAAVKRKKIGFFEQDTVLGKQKGPCLLTLTDRKTGFEQIRKIAGKKAEFACPAIIEVLSSLPEDKWELLISDRGKEFANYEAVYEALGCKTFYCDSHAPWQRGTNENTNGLIRQYLPKGKSMDDVSEEEINRIQNELNTRPRKRLGWRTPLEVFYGIVLHLI